MNIQVISKHGISEKDANETDKNGKVTVYTI